MLSASLLLTISIIYHVFFQQNTINKPITKFNVNVNSQTDLPSTNDKLTTPDNKNKLISITQKVTQTNNQFNYYYKITYNGKEPCLIQSELIDKLTNKKSNFIEFLPNSSQEFSIVSSQPTNVTVTFNLLTAINGKPENITILYEGLLP